MSERDPSQKSEGSRADLTLMGVAPPRIDSLPDSIARRPVVVRAGTSVADEDPPLPRAALPSRPMLPNTGLLSETPPAVTTSSRADVRKSRALELLRRQPVLWRVGIPVLAAAGVIGILVATSSTPAAKVEAKTAPAATGAAVVSPAPVSKPKRAGLPELEGKPAESLSASELLTIAEGRSERRVDSAKELREKLSKSPELLRDKAVQVELFRLAADPETAREALAALAAAPAPLSADLLYEVWTGTTARTDATELAHALVYSTDVRPQASPALAVALLLRAAETCAEFQGVLPAATKDGDRRVLHLLTKLTNKRGCGAKKTEDCYSCLREPKDALPAAIEAVKARRAPSYPTPPVAR